MTPALGLLVGTLGLLLAGDHLVQVALGLVERDDCSMLRQAVGGIAGLLKAKVGTNEGISTRLRSFIAVWMVDGAAQRHDG